MNLRPAQSQVSHECFFSVVARGLREPGINCCRVFDLVHRHDCRHGSAVAADGRRRCRDCLRWDDSGALAAGSPVGGCWVAPAAGCLAWLPDDRVWLPDDRVWLQVGRGVPPGDPVLPPDDRAGRQDGQGAPPGDPAAPQAGPGALRACRAALPGGPVCRQACPVGHSDDPGVHPACRAAIPVDPVARQDGRGEHSGGRACRRRGDRVGCPADPDAKSRAADRRAGPDATPSD
jgi:hypothetical protein